MPTDLFVGETSSGEYVITAGIYKCDCRLGEPNHIFQENLVIFPKNNVLEVKHGTGGSNSKIEVIATFTSSMRNLAKLFCEGRILRYAKERYKKIASEPTGHNTNLINLLDEKQAKEYWKKVRAG
jgi:hypothetical protein